LTEEEEEEEEEEEKNVYMTVCLYWNVAMGEFYTHNSLNCF
jgi:hypothetical protein